MMTTQPLTIRIGATMAVRLRRLRHEQGGDYPPDATVSYTLFDANIDPVAGAINVPMPFVAGATPERGRYVGRLSSAITAECTPEERYTILIIAVAPDQSRLPTVLECVARI